MIEIKVTLDEPKPGRLGAHLEMSPVTNSSPGLSKIAMAVMCVLRRELHMPESETSARLTVKEVVIEGNNKQN